MKSHTIEKLKCQVCKQETCYQIEGERTVYTAPKLRGSFRAGLPDPCPQCNGTGFDGWKITEEQRVHLKDLLNAIDEVVGWYGNFELSERVKEAFFALSPEEPK